MTSTIFICLWIKVVTTTTVRGGRKLSSFFFVLFLNYYTPHKHAQKVTIPIFFFLLSEAHFCLTQSFAIVSRKWMKWKIRGHCFPLIARLGDCWFVEIDFQRTKMRLKIVDQSFTSSELRVTLNLSANSSICHQCKDSTLIFSENIDESLRNSMFNTIRAVLRT